jgi:hypothetical protein
VLGRKLGITLLLVGLAALGGPAAASAATSWYAAPAAQGTGDCGSAANACPLATAVAGAASGDTIYVLGNLGDYNLGAGTVNPGSKVLHFVGMNGMPRLIATASSAVLTLSAAPSSATGLYLENDGNGDGLFVSPVTGSGGFAIDRLFVKTTGATTSHTCFMGGEVMLMNSVCWQANSSASSGGITTEFSNIIRNVVAWQSGSGTAVQCAGVYGDGDLTVINTIARATGTGGSDLGAFSTGSFNSTVTVRYSNFGTAVLQGPGTSMDHINTDATDQSATPALVDPLAGNFREQSTSPTINAGVTDSANGALDLEGNPRTVGGTTDIGAYELGRSSTPPPTTPPPNMPPKLVPPDSTRITKTRIIEHRRTAIFKFKASGTVTGFQCSLIRRKKGKHTKPHFASCSSPRKYKHLKHGKYTFEVRAVNSAGPDPIPAIKKFKL